MKERLIGLVRTYVLFVLLFVVQKPLFMAVHASLYTDVAWTDWLRVMWHGLPLDLSLAGYLSALPGLFFLASAWTLGRGLHRVWCGYFVFVSVLMSVIAVTDAVLYSYWGFRLDATPVFYFLSSPRDCLASVSVWAAIGGVLLMVAYAALLYAIFYAVLLRRRSLLGMKLPYRRLTVSAVMLVATGVLFIPIRGGFTVSTMNTGKVYFSDNQRLNHAAINPAFSLMESLSKQKDFGAQYRYLEPAEADRRFQSMLDPQVLALRAGVAADSLPALRPDSAGMLLRTERPDVVLVILESFSSHLMASLGGRSDVAVNLDSLAATGVLFTRLHANSFRTDRGLVSILSGYPAQPTTSLMKYPRKSQQVPALAGALRQVGYDAKYYYGGDADFTNMRSYLMSSGFGSIVADTDFPLSERLSKWGVHDHLVFRRLLDDLAADTTRAPLFRVLQTSSSHEPFEVPYRRLADDRLNAFAYTDSCVGDFVRRFRELPRWERTLLVFVPDHLGAWPEDVDNLSFDRYRIPLLLVGGAVKGARRVDTCGSQQDLAATLLAQLGLPHGQFTFSKDLMNPAAPHFAFFTFPDAFGLQWNGSQAVFDNQAGRLVSSQGAEADEVLRSGKAYLQKLYDDLARL